MSDDVPSLLSRITCRFIEIQQSGELPDWNRVRVSEPGGWRGDAHLADGTGPDTIDADLSGGWYADGGKST